MKLYVVQHGEAKDEREDPSRPLTVRGRRDMERLGHLLGERGIRVTDVIHSGKVRARESAEVLAQIIAPGVNLRPSDMLHPNDPPGPFGWQAESWDHDTLVVGHLPFVARLVAHLVAGDDGLNLTRFQPGCAVCLERDQQGNWTIAWMLPPELLRGNEM